MQKKRQLKTCIVVVVLMCLLTVSMTFQTICVKTISDNYINSLIVNQIIDLIIDEETDANFQQINQLQNKIKKSDALYQLNRYAFDQSMRNTNKNKIKLNGDEIMSDIKEFENKMSKTVDALKEDYVTIRAGRANPHILDKIKVDYYGTPTSLQQVANISVPEARMIQIQPWESSLIKEIEKAILVSDLGITPNNDGKVIRLIFPELTEDRRKELAKEVKKKGDNAKVAIRNVRRDANDLFKKQNKAGEISDDELKGTEDDIQKLTDKYVDIIDATVEEKTKEILTV